MKKSFTKRGMLSLLSGFFLFVTLMLTASSAGAQGTMNQNWKQTDQAQPALITEIAKFDNDLQSLPPGSALDNAKAHVYYYKEIYSMLLDGQSVPNAVHGALNTVSGTAKINGQPSMYLDVQVTPVMRTQLFNDAVAFLQ